MSYFVLSLTAVVDFLLPGVLRVAEPVSNRLHRKGNSHVVDKSIYLWRIALNGIPIYLASLSLVGARNFGVIASVPTAFYGIYRRFMCGFCL